MKWLEIIELRTVNLSHQNMKSKIRSIIEEFHKVTDNHTIKVYNRLALESDLSIHLFHHSNKPDINGSEVGLRIASALKEFGLTNHSIWIEKSGE